MGKKINLAGRKFRKLTALHDTGERKWGLVMWLCRCDCGNLTRVVGSHLINGNTKSCGCLRNEMPGKKPIHGDAGYTKARLYITWRNMKDRCYNPRAVGYRYYNAKDIKVCPEWKNDYPAFKTWAINNGYKDNLTIDRIDSWGDYRPDNCQFISKSENTRKARREKCKTAARLCNLHADFTNGKSLGREDET